MSSPLRTPEDYELFLYTLAEQFPSIVSSTLVFIRRGAALARVEGEIRFDGGLKLVVRERILLNRLPLAIDSYGYEVWRGSEKLYWYDSQPHPDDPTLQSTHPHHKHIPPDTTVREEKRSGIKHHRIPAPGLSFNRANLPLLIQEIEGLSI
jgi:hypothetical protein